MPGPQASAYLGNVLRKTMQRFDAALAGQEGHYPLIAGASAALKTAIDQEVPRRGTKRAATGRRAYGVDPYTTIKRLRNRVSYLQTCRRVLRQSARYRDAPRRGQMPTLLQVKVALAAPAGNMTTSMTTSMLEGSLNGSMTATSTPNRGKGHKFTFDYAYWSHNKADHHFADQSKVRTPNKN